MELFKRLWNDELGAVLSAEVATVASVVVVGTVAGLTTAATAINAELTDMAKSFRSLDQSYSYSGFGTPHAYVAGSCFWQECVEKSTHDLCPVPAKPAPVPAVEEKPVPAVPMEAPKAEVEAETPAGEKLE